MKWIERTLLLLLLAVTTVTQAQEIEESEELIALTKTWEEDLCE